MEILFFLTLGLVLGLGYVFAQTDRQEVMANWDKRRCDPFVLFASNLYKPSTDPRSSTKFAIENFQFCTNTFIQQVFTVAINPFLTLVREQLGAVNLIQESIASVKVIIGNFYRSFSKILDGLYNRFIGIAFQFRKIFVLFLTAMKRAFGIAIATVYSGMSMLVGVQNLYDAVIKVVLIVIGILAGLVIILFLAFFPVIPIILTTVSVLVAGGVGAAAGFSGVFCFAPTTPIETNRGSVRIDEVQLGDTLKDGGRVEGILRVNGSGTSIYSLRGVRVSGDHLVYNEKLQSWILVKEHPEARLEIKQEPLLICLNTSTREIPIEGLRFRDWEEIPPGDEDIQKAWNELIAEMLGSDSANTSDDYAMLSGAWKVETPAELIALRDVQIGMKVKDIDGNWTKVLGIYTGEEEIVSDQGPFWSSKTIWWRKSNSWMQSPDESQVEMLAHKRKGFHLITDSGSFCIWSEECKFGVRDFTEVGQSRIAETYEWMKKRL